MMLKQYRGWPWPGIGDDQELLDWLAARADMSSPVFDDLDDFLRANINYRGRPPNEG